MRKQKQKQKQKQKKKKKQNKTKQKNKTKQNKKKKKKTRVQQSKLNEEKKEIKQKNQRECYKHQGHFGLSQARPFCSLFYLDFSPQIREIAFWCAQGKRTIHVYIWKLKNNCNVCGTNSFSCTQ